MRIRIREFMQDEGAIGTGDDFLTGRVIFDLSDGQTEIAHGLTATVKQTAGGTYQTAPIEVGLPEEAIAAKLHYDCFRNAVEDYYRKVMPDFDPRSTDITMTGNMFIGPPSIYECPDPEP